MDSKEILGIYKELTDKKYKKYFGKLSEIEEYITPKKLSREDYTILLSLLSEDDIFAWLNYISSKIEEIADDSEIFLSFITSVINKIKGDLAQSDFINALIKIGKKNPDLGLKIYDKIITSSRDETIISYAGFILGGVGKEKPDKIYDYILKILHSENNPKIDPIKIAVTKAVRIMITEKDKLDNSDFYFSVLDNVSQIENSENLKSEALHLNFEMFKFNEGICFRNILKLGFNKTSDSLQYEIAHRLWVYGMEDVKKEFILINQISKSDNKNVLTRIAYYLAQNHAKNKETSFEIISDWIKRSADVYELHYVLNEMGKSDFDYYSGKFKDMIKNEGDLAVLYSLLYSIDYLAEKNKEAQKNLPELKKLINDRTKEIRKK